MRQSLYTLQRFLDPCSDESVCLSIQPMILSSHHHPLEPEAINFCPPLKTSSLFYLLTDDTSIRILLHALGIVIGGHLRIVRPVCPNKLKDRVRLRHLRLLRLFLFLRFFFFGLFFLGFFLLSLLWFLLLLSWPLLV